MVFLQNSLRSLAGNFRAEFDPEQGIRIPEQGIWRPPGIPTRRDFVGRARLAGAALAGGHDCIAASVHSAFDDVRLASQFESPPSTQSPRIRGWLGEPCLENRSSPKIGNRSLTSMPSYEVGAGIH
jgi:hypothetical protein